MKASRRLKHSWLSVLSLNVQGAIRRNIGELESYLLQHKIDIAAIQEAQLPTPAKVEAQGYKTFQHPGGDVLFFVAAHLLPFTVMEQPMKINCGSDSRGRQALATYLCAPRTCLRNLHLLSQGRGRSIPSTLPLHGSPPWAK